MRLTLTRTAMLVFALALAPASLVASPAPESRTDGELSVVATTTIVADIVSRVGGERISLYVMLPAGTDPHVFQPTPRDARHVADADVVFANGAGLEADFLGDLISSAAPRRVVELSEHLPLRRMGMAHGESAGAHDEHGDEGEDHDEDEEEHHDEHEDHEEDEEEHHDEHGEDHDEDEEEHHDEHEDHEEDEEEHHDEHEEDHDEDEEEHHDEDEHVHDHGEFDPHVWMDPTLVAVWAVEVAEALAEIDPEYAAEYDRRAAELVRELDELDGWIKQHVAAVPRDRRVLVTDHESLAYFAARYGFELLDSVIPGVSTASEPSARHLAQLREVIAEHAVPAIFVGVGVNPQVAQSVASDLGIEVVQIYAGSLSEPDGPAATYQDFMRTNVERIVAALGAAS